MNPIIKKQLEKCQIAQIPKFDEDTLELIIPKQCPQGSAALTLEHYYQIELADYLLNPPPEFNLHINWNRGVIPSSKVMRVYPIQKLGNMVKVDGCGYDPSTESLTEDQYMGLWLPADGIKILKEIE